MSRTAEVSRRTVLFGGPLFVGGCATGPTLMTTPTTLSTTPLAATQAGPKIYKIDIPNASGPADTVAFNIDGEVDRQMAILADRAKSGNEPLKVTVQPANKALDLSLGISGTPTGTASGFVEGLLGPAAKAITANIATIQQSGSPYVHVIYSGDLGKAFSTLCAVVATPPQGPGKGRFFALTCTRGSISTTLGLKMQLEGFGLGGK